MSKADYRKIFCEICMSKSQCGYYRDNDGEYCPMLKFYDMGYHQAEKDLELTWEDVLSLKMLLDEVENEFKKGQHEDKDFIGYCTEVLKRFREMKGE